MTIPIRALIDLSGEKEEENKSRDIAQIDVEGTLSESINQYKSQQTLNGTISNSNSSNSEGCTNHRNDLMPGKLWYDKLSVVQQRAGCMAAAQQVFDKMVRQQETMMIFIMMIM